MRLITALALPLVLSLAACGAGKPEGVVRFTGLAPNTAAQKAKDNRAVRTTCPNPLCMNPIAFGATKCNVKNCETVMSWDAKKEGYGCPSCNSSGVCSACVLLEQNDGKCFDCAGTGSKVYLGKSPDCPNCKGKKMCPICEGSRKCDYCKGAGKLDAETVKALVEKSAPPKGDEEAKPEGGK